MRELTVPKRHRRPRIPSSSQRCQRAPPLSGEPPLIVARLCQVNRFGDIASLLLNRPNCLLLHSQRAIPSIDGGHPRGRPGAIYRTAAAACPGAKNPCPQVFFGAAAKRSRAALRLRAIRAPAAPLPFLAAGPWLCRLSAGLSAPPWARDSASRGTAGAGATRSG